MTVTSLALLLPSWWEIEATFAFAILLIVVYSLFEKISRVGLWRWRRRRCRNGGRSSCRQR
ncbi:hypothetical protein KSP40_PGU000210 [Platanthera guangdongensis]|uniref:Uncharacterized protein n=1 Tax=Platanthera guangdongensis TaxID=2320717 RepID=A0ABR2LR06_9ASPA